MSTLHRTATAALVGLLVAPAALAGGGGGEIPSDLGSAGPLIAQHAFNLAVLLGGLFIVVRKPIAAALVARREGISAAIEAAAQAEAKAKARAAELEAKVAGLEAELAALRAEADRNAALEREELLTRARAEAASLEASAGRTIRDETDKAIAALRAEAAAQAVQLAAAQVQARITDADHARLDRQFLTSVSGSAAPVPHG
jgi:F-type H+-transporting ATPase subunit b